LPIYSLKCERCGKIEDRLYASYKELCLTPAARCPIDGSRMERVPSAPAFKVEGFNAANNYGVKP
jgi:predicted nucleic acid-binding Zn ribbon protein